MNRVYQPQYQRALHVRTTVVPAVALIVLLQDLLIVAATQLVLATVGTLAQRPIHAATAAIVMSAVRACVILL